MSEALPSWTFHHATRRVITGAGRLTALAELIEEFGCNRIAVVLDPYFSSGGMQQRLASLFELATVTGAFHVVAAGEPDIRGVEHCRLFLEQSDADMVVAIGGGSAMDVAKVARAHLANPGPLQALAGPAGAGPVRGRLAPAAPVCVCVPTTAGTGAEISESAIIGETGPAARKLIFRSAELAATIAILDPELAVTAPARVTATAGFDAITHAVEAFTSTLSGPLTDPLAGSAMQLLSGAVAHSVRDPGDLTARSMALLGSMQAAMAFNSANFGLAHAISGALGALYKVPHGMANALALPWTMAYNHADLGQKGNAVAAIFGADTPAAGLSRLRHEIGLDLSLDHFVVGDDKLDKVAEAAMVSGELKMNPREPVLDEVRLILEHMRQPTGGDPPILLPR